jgi:hypothetical protein
VGTSAKASGDFEIHRTSVGVERPGRGPA